MRCMEDGFPAVNRDSARVAAGIPRLRSGRHEQGVIPWIGQFME
jgi:hypothetical protein